jgi:cytoskeleton protein RodZ
MAPPGSFSHGTEGGKSLSEEPGLTVGQYLRQEREKRKVTLDSVAKVTRITKENLEALENDEFQAISAPVFARGFLRNYATYLGLDPRELLARYESQTDRVKISRAEEAAQPSKEKNPLFRYLLFLCILLAGAAIIYYLQKPPVPTSPASPSSRITPAPSPLSPSTAPGAPPSPPKTAASPEKAAPAGIPPGKKEQPPEKVVAAATVPGEKETTPNRRHTLKAVTTEKTWMRIRDDEGQVSDVLLQPKETSTWTARRQFYIIVGNAGGVELFFDGVSQGRLGKSGEVIHLVLPREAEAAPSSAAAPGKEPPPPKDSKPAGPKP